MTTELTEAEAQKLFHEVSQSIRTNDTLKLDELVDVKPVEGNPEPEELPAVVEEQPPVEEPVQEAPSSNDGTQEPTPPVVAEEEPAKTDAQTPDELATLKAQLEGLKKENHHLKSQAGRMPHLQSRVKDMDKKLEELRTQLNSPSSQPSTKIKPELQKKLAKLRETDPELADVIEEASTATADGTHRERIQAEIDSTEALRKSEYEAYHAAQWGKLVEEVPNADKIFKGKHWTDWKGEQSKAIQALASSDDADDVIFAIRKYEQDMIAKYPELAPKVETPAVPAPDAAAAEKAKQIEQQRAQRKQTSVVATSPSAPAQVTSPSDATSLFNKFSDEIRKARLG